MLFSGHIFNPVCYVFFFFILIFIHSSVWGFFLCLLNKHRFFQLHFNVEYLITAGLMCYTKISTARKYCVFRGRFFRKELNGNVTPRFTHFHSISIRLDKISPRHYLNGWFYCWIKFDLIFWFAFCNSRFFHLNWCEVCNAEVFLCDCRIIAKIMCRIFHFTSSSMLNS